MWLNPPIWLGKKNDHIPMFTHPACSGYCQYFDMTVDRIFERVNVLGAEVHRLNLALSRSAGAAETVRPSARAMSAASVSVGVSASSVWRSRGGLRP